MFASSLSHLLPSRVPTILCGSCALKLTVKRGAQALGTSRDVEEMKADLSPSPPVSSSDARMHAREKKAMGLNAIARWCAARQLCPRGVDSLQDECPAAALDVSVLEWIHTAKGTLTCPQSMVLIILLGDVVCRSMPAEGTSGGDGSREAQLCQAMLGVMAELLEGVVSSLRLEDQPLPLLLSCVYALHKVTSKRDAFEAAGVTVGKQLDPPADLFFVIIHSIRSRALQENALRDDPAVSIELLLTFLVVLTPSRRRDLLTANDQPMFKAVFSSLQERVRAALMLACGGDGNEDGGGSGVGRDPLSALLSRRSIAAPEDEAHTGRVDLDDTLRIMESVSMSSAVFRLELLGYLWLCRGAFDDVRASDVAQVVSVLRTLNNIERSRRTPLTDAIVAQLPHEALHCTAAIGLLPFTVKPETVLQEQLSAIDVNAISSSEAASILLAVNESSLPIPWAMEYPLFTAVLREHVDSERLSLAARANPSQRDDSSTAPLVPLTAGVCAVLRSLFRSPACDDPDVDASGDDVDAGNLLSDATLLAPVDGNLPERQHLRRTLPLMIDWARGCVDDTPSKSSTTLEMWKVYRACVRDSPGTLPVLSQAELLEKYAAPMMRISVRNGQGVEGTLSELVSMIPLLLAGTEKNGKHKDGVRGFVESLIRFNGVKSVTSLVRFAYYIAPYATRVNVRDSELLKHLLKLSLLDPLKLLRRRTHTTIGSAPSLVLHQTLLCNAVRYVFFCAPWKEVATRERRLVGLWFSRFFAAYMEPRKQGTTASTVATDSIDDIAVVDDDAVVGDGGDADHEEDDDADEDGGGQAAGASAADESEGETVGAGDPEAAVSPLLAEGEKMSSSPSLVGNICRTDLRMEDLEEVLELALLTETKIPSYMFTEIRAKTERWLQHTSLSADAASSVFRLPAHYVFLCKGKGESLFAVDVPFAVALLDVCDALLFPFVYSLLLRQLIDSVSPEQSKVFISKAFRIVQQKLTREREENQEKDADAFLAEHGFSLAARKMIATSLAALQRLEKSAATTVVRSAADAEGAATDADGRSLGGLATGDDADHEADAATAVDEVDSSVMLDDETQACGVALISQFPFSSVVFLCTTQLRNLSRFAPSMAKAVFDILRPELGSLDQSSLIRIACLYPEGAKDILPALLNASSAATSVVAAGAATAASATAFDTSSFLSAASKLPIGIVEGVVASQLPNFSTASCTRLLSALAQRREPIPNHILFGIIKRVETECSEPISSSQRSLLLAVLQKFVTVIHAEADGDQPNGTAASFSMAEARERNDAIRRCCDSLLRLDSITDMESLREFLGAYPPSLYGVTRKGVVERAKTAVIMPLLEQQPSVPLSSAIAALELLHEHHLLTCSVARAVLDSTFLGNDFGDAPFDMARMQNYTRVALLSAQAQADVDTGSSSSSNGNGDSSIERALTALRKICFSYARTVAEQLAVLTYLVELNAQLGNTNFQGTALTTGSASDTPRLNTRFLFTESIGQKGSLLKELCTTLLTSSQQLSSSDFAKLMQHVSRLRYWTLLDAEGFGDAFRRSYQRADGHSRCILLKALSQNKEVFAAHEALMVGLLDKEVGVLSLEDLEIVLTATLRMNDLAAVESLVDTISTRVRPLVDQCRLSLLVRLLQCHAHFSIDDAELFKVALRTLDEKCSHEVKLDVAQVITLLTAISKLDVELPERLVVMCFQRLERGIHGISNAQLAQVGELCVELEMGYIPCVQTIVVRILENRDARHGNERYRRTTELLCDVYDVEAVPYLRATRLRKRREKERIAAFWRATHGDQQNEA